MEERDGRQENGRLLTQEEEASLRLLEPLFARHLGSDPDPASLLSDDLAVARLKCSQQEYLLSLVSGKNERSVGGDGAPAAQYCDPFGLGADWHLRSFVYFLTSVQPLVFEAFGSRPRVHHRVWSALLKVVFHDLELAMSGSLKQRDDLVEAAVHEASEARRTLELALNKQEVEENQRQTEHRTVVSLLTTWLTKTSELAQEMGSPLNVILGRAESLMERAEDDTAQAALQSIVRQVERLISLRQQLCLLDHGLRSKSHAPDLKATAEGPLAGC